MNDIHGGRCFAEQQFAFLILAPAAVVIFGVVLVPLVTTFIYSLKNMELISAERGKLLGLLELHAVLRLRRGSGRRWDAPSISPSSPWRWRRSSASWRRFS